VNPGGSTTATLYLTAASKTDRQYAITSNNPQVVPTVNLMVPAGQTNGSVVVPTNVAAVKSAATLSVTGNSVTKTAILAVMSNSITSATMDSTSVMEGASPNLTIHLAYPASVNQVVSITSSAAGAIASFNATVSNSDTVTVPVPVSVAHLTTAKAVVLYLQLKDGFGNLIGAKVPLTITDNPQIVSMTPATASVSGGATYTGQINLFGPFPGPTQTITVMSNYSGLYFTQGGTASLSQTVTVHTGDTTIPFSFTTNRRTTGVANAVVTAVSPLGYVSRAVKVSITP